MRFSWSNHLLISFSFENLTPIRRTDLPILVKLIDPVNSVINSNDLTQMVNFSTRIPDCDTILLIWISFFLLALVFVLQWLFFHWKILNMFLCQLPLTFHHIHNEMPYFITLLLTILVPIGMAFVIIWEMFIGGYL